MTTGAFTYDADVFGFSNLSEGVTIADVGIYKDLNETFLYLRDPTKSYKALTPAYVQINDAQGKAVALNFQVSRRDAQSDYFDMLVCSKNNTGDLCQLYEINTKRGFLGLSGVRYNLRANVHLQGKMCAESIVLR